LTTSHAPAGDHRAASDRDLEIHSLGRQGVGTIRKGSCLLLQLGAHLPGQHVDGAGAEHAERVALVAELGGHRLGNGIESLRQDEDVGDEVPASPGAWLRVTTVAGVRLWRGGADEVGLIRYALIAGPRRGRAPLAIADVELCDKELLARF
jgi:hypothetical protein